jgi:signal transduction histidine kinase
MDDDRCCLHANPRPYVSTTLQTRILVIDDEFAPRESLRVLLGATYDVHVADSVDGGMAILNEAPVDLIILDLRMPGKNGLDALAEIRAVDPSVSIIMLTGYGTLDAARQAIHFGVTEFLEKPFDVREMMKVIEAGLQATCAKRRRCEAEATVSGLEQRLGGALDKRMHMAEVGQMSAEFAHDLRNPLTIIQGYIQVLGKRWRQPSQGELPPRYFNIIEQNLRRCTDLLELWQGLSANVVRQSDEFDVAEIIAALVRDLTTVDSDVHIMQSVDSCIISGDRVQLYRALANLINNAMHAVAEGGEVEIAGHRVGHKFEIEVRDNGCGMSKHTLERVFDPFYTTKNSDIGNGLGMFIVRKVIEIHGGAISINSRPSWGTRVSICLPIEQESPESQDECLHIVGV